MAALPVLPTVARTYRFVFANTALLAEIGRLWAIAAAVLFVLSWLLLALALQSGDPDTGAPIPPGEQASAVTAFPGLVILIGAYIVVVRWHRLIIRHVTPAETRGKTGGAGFLYFARSLFLGACGAAILLIGSLTPVVLSRGAALPDAVKAAIPIVSTVTSVTLALLMVARLSLILPAAAVGDHGMTLRKSWQLTRGNSWRLLVGSALASGPAIVVTFALNVLLDAVPTQGTQATALIIAIAISFVLSVLTAVIQASFLSYAYLFFTETAARDA